MVRSILDNDLYKFIMAQAVHKLYPHHWAEYRFINRGEQRFNSSFLDLFNKEVTKLKSLLWGRDESHNKWRIADDLSDAYTDHISYVGMGTVQLDYSLTEDSDLSLTVSGPWLDAILWEVPLMATISECYFKTCFRDWPKYGRGQAKIAHSKSDLLAYNNVPFADFGTRRRRNYAAQNKVVGILKRNPCFLGTSNVWFAIQYNTQPIGTIAHEWYMAHSAGGGDANALAMDAWRKAWGNKHSITLTDTYTTDAFLASFNRKRANEWDGVRQDSGDPFVFTDKIVKHYTGMNINPTRKMIVFSDSLTPQKCVDLSKHCNGRIRCSFGIGTNFSNDFPEGKPLNMVIKLSKINGHPVYKLSDDPAKAT